MADAPGSARFSARFNELTWYRRNVPCMQACPVHTDSGRYVQLIAEGRFEEAFLESTTLADIAKHPDSPTGAAS